MRPGEAIALQPGDWMSVSTPSELNGRNPRRTGEIYKTAEVRTVDLSAKLIPKLEAYRAWLELEL